MRHRLWPDRIGMIAATGCALHCATLTLVFLIYPTLWMKRKYWEMGLWQKLMWLEWSFLAASWLLVLIAMTLGWLRHRHPGPAVLALLAVIAMTLLILTPLHNAGYWTSGAALVAGMAIALAHWWNLKLGHCSHNI